MRTGLGSARVTDDAITMRDLPPRPVTVLVAGDDDPYLPEGIGAAYGLPLKIATTVIPGGAHLNTDAGYGEWPAVLDWCRRDNLAFY